MADANAAAPADRRVPPSLFTDLPVAADGRLATLSAVRDAFGAIYRLSVADDAGEEASDRKRSEP